MSISLSNPAVTIAGIKQFGLAPDGSDLRDLCAAIDSRDAEIERLHERLEDNRVYDLDGNRIAVKPGSIPDGIDARDETIKLQDERIDRQLAEIERLRNDNDRLLAVMQERVNHPHTDGETRRRLRAALGIEQTERCEVTGNPVGTDTWMVGHPCQCAACQRMVRRSEQTGETK